MGKSHERRVERALDRQTELLAMLVKYSVTQDVFAPGPLPLEFGQNDEPSRQTQDLRKELEATRVAHAQAVEALVRQQHYADGVATLEGWMTRQIVKNPNTIADQVHNGAFNEALGTLREIFGERTQTAEDDSSPHLHPEWGGVHDDRTYEWTCDRCGKKYDSDHWADISGHEDEHDNDDNAQRGAE